jgi:hypothetical protein
MKKFETLLEGVFQRYQGGGFLSGDIVTIKSDALSNEWTKTQPQAVIDKIKEMMDGDLNIRVSAVKAIRPASSGDAQQDNQVTDFYCDVVRERAPGLYHDFVTVPGHILEINNPEGPNLQPVPDSLKHDAGDHIDPKEYKKEYSDTSDTSKPHGQTCYTDDGSGKLNHSDIEPAKSDTKGTGKKWDDKKAGGGNYVSSVYLTGLK